MDMRKVVSGLITGMLLSTVFVAGAVSAATFDLARRPDGTIIQGLRIEGEIVPGDAQRLLDAYAKYGTSISPLYLRSIGGDVEEAMRMGILVRRLRLETRVPVWDSGRSPVDPIKVERQEDAICASACFLVYAGGATRFGNYLALHRPYLARKDAQTLTDIEYEAIQKGITPKVKAYLADMDIDQYWIDRMFAANSQEHYMPAWAEADSKVRHLMGMVPSLEEVVLSKCKEAPGVDKKLQAYRASLNGPPTQVDIEKMKAIMHEADVFAECQKTVLSDMQQAAFERENEPAVDAKCGPFPLTQSETATFKALNAKGQNVTAEEVTRRQVFLTKYLSSQPCRAEAKGRIGMAAALRWYEEVQKSQPKPLSQLVADDFDAKELSAADMVKRGRDAYKAERWEAAARWFRKAADLGDGDGMMGMSWIYGNGRGVPQDDAERLHWVRTAADHGSKVAMESLGHDYEHGGKGVTQDYAEAMRWYRKAADLGSYQAMTSVGQMFNQGIGVPLDYTEAMNWFRKAADVGGDFALVQIGWLYDLGHGVPKDEEQARFWMKKAATSGDMFVNATANQWLVQHPAP